MLKQFSNKFILVTLLLIAVLISNCSNKNENKKTKIIFWHSFVATTIPALNDLIKRFETEYPNIEIDAQYVPTGDALVQKLITAIQSGTAPDVSWIHADFLDKLVESNSIYPMDHFIKGEMGLNEEEMSDFFPQLLNEFKLNDTLYALPMESTVLALIYNKDHFKAAGINPDRPPETWNDLREYEND